MYVIEKIEKIFNGGFLHFVFLHIDFVCKTTSVRDGKGSTAVLGFDQEQLQHDPSREVHRNIQGEEAVLPGMGVIISDGYM